MRYFHPNIERHMRKTEGRWKALRFLQHTGVIGAITSLAALALGIAMLRGWVENPYAALTLLVAFCGAGALAWVVAAVVQAGRGKPRQWLAGHLEKAYNPLLDRINTLVFLGAKKPDAATHSYAKRIEAQASQLLAKAQPPNPFRATRPLLHIGVFVALLCCTVWFYNRYSPIAKLMDAWKAHQLLAKQDDPARAFKLPDADASEEKKPWSEVRITDPDGDIKATKVDVVPLEIEAASNQSLNNVGWALNVNGGAEQQRPLDPPSEPHYAVYQPTLALDELRLSDWDVVSYYAKASTDGGGNSSSDLYFIEIRPFREDLMKMPGGEGGKAASEMGEMTTLIDRQRTILRQTHRYDQQPNPDAKVREQDRKKLQDAESELGDSVNQYYAKMAADFENQPIADTLDHLAMAGTHIGHAVGALRNDMAPQAVTDEQSALTELAATRKNFSKFVTDHPEAFPDGGSGEKPDEQKPFTASDQLDKIAEFRDTQKAASDFLQKAQEKQKQIADAAKAAAGSKQSQTNSGANNPGNSGSQQAGGQQPGAGNSQPGDSQPGGSPSGDTGSSPGDGNGTSSPGGATQTADGGSPSQGGNGNSPSSAPGGNSPAQGGAPGNTGAPGNGGANASDLASLAKAQDDLNKSLADFEAQNPGAFHDLSKQTADAQAAMKNAASTLKTADARSQLINTLNSGKPGQPGQQGMSGNAAAAARVATAQENAVNSLEELKNAFDSKDTMHQLQQAHELKKLLDQQAKDLDKAGSQPGAPSQSQLAQTGKAAGTAADQLKDIVDHTSAGKAFGPQLHNALSEDQQAKLDDQLTQLSQAKDPASQKSAAQDAASSLRDITKAFDASLPATMRQAQQQPNPLTPNAEEALNQALQELQSLQSGQQNGAPGPNGGGNPTGDSNPNQQPPSPEQQKQQQDALLNLQKSLPQLYGNNDATKNLLDQASAALHQGAGKPMDIEALKKLVDEIQNLRIELGDKKMEKPDKDEISHIDPSKLPPEYRERVERYFQKLSEE